jgi:hypothetical protein
MSKYKQSRSSVNDALQGLNKIIKNLNEDYEKYTAKPDHSAKAAFFMQSRIGELTSILLEIDEFIESSNAEVLQTAKKAAEKDETINKLITICLFHGITNINYYMSLRINDIIALSNFYDPVTKQTTHFYQTPLAFMPNSPIKADKQLTELFKPRA